MWTSGEEHPRREDGKCTGPELDTQVCVRMSEAGAEWARPVVEVREPQGWGRGLAPARV